MKRFSYLLIAYKLDFLQDRIFHYIDEYIDKNLKIGHVDVILIYGKTKTDIKLTLQTEKDKLVKVKNRSDEQKNIFENISNLLELLEDENLCIENPQSVKDWSDSKNREVTSENSVFINCSVD